MVLTNVLSSSWRPGRSIIRLCFLLGDHLTTGLQAAPSAKGGLKMRRTGKGGGKNRLARETTQRMARCACHQSR
jgi:hypothetical protein